MIKKGATIEIRPEFQDAGDADYTWIVVSDEEKGRFDAWPVDIEMNIKPVFTFTPDQVRVVA